MKKENLTLFQKTNPLSFIKKKKKAKIRSRTSNLDFLYNRVVRLTHLGTKNVTCEHDLAAISKAKEKQNWNGDAKLMLEDIIPFIRRKNVQAYI